MAVGKQKNDESAGTDRAVLIAMVAFTAVGNIAYFAGAVSHVGRANSEGFVSDVPIIGWAWAGFSDMWHSGVAGVGPLIAFWTIMVVGLSAVSVVTWRLWRKRGAGGGSSSLGGMSEEAAARHNAKLGVRSTTPP